MTAVEQQTLSFVEAAGGNHRREAGRGYEGCRDLRKDDGVSRSVRPDILGNALAYGAAAKPVRVIAETVGDRFKLSVSNAGDTIPAATLQRMFLPFARGTIRPDQQGLGLGLYIASEIARAHGGTLTVESRDAETTLTFRMPSGPVA